MTLFWLWRRIGLTWVHKEHQNEGHLHGPGAHQANLSIRYRGRARCWQSSLRPGLGIIGLVIDRDRSALRSIAERSIAGADPRLGSAIDQ